MSRKNARELALHLVFEMCFQPDETAETMDARLTKEEMQSIGQESLVYLSAVSEKDKYYVQAVVNGVAQNRAALDKIIEQYSKGWKLSRISRMTIAILRLALFEIQYVDDVPAGAAINEAVELAKQYAPEETAKFINGILGSYVRQATGEIIPVLSDEEPTNTPIADTASEDAVNHTATPVTEETNDA